MTLLAIIFCICTAVAFELEDVDVDYDYLKEKMISFRVVPEILLEYTKFIANVTFPNMTRTIIPGELLSLRAVSQKPVVEWECNDTTYHSLLFTDMDDRVHQHYIFHEYQLWFVTNIPGKDVDKGEERLPYRPPNVKNRKHRIFVVIFQQNHWINMTGNDFQQPLRNNMAVLEVLYEIPSTAFASTVFYVSRSGLANFTEPKSTAPDVPMDYGENDTDIYTSEEIIRRADFPIESYSIEITTQSTRKSHRKPTTAQRKRFQRVKPEETSPMS